MRDPNYPGWERGQLGNGRFYWYLRGDTSSLTIDEYYDTHVDPDMLNKQYALIDNFTGAIGQDKTVDIIGVYDSFEAAAMMYRMLYTHEKYADFSS